MEKSRLGISVGVVAAIVYLAGLLDGFVLLLVAAFYVLFCQTAYLCAVFGNVFP